MSDPVAPSAIKRGSFGEPRSRSNSPGMIAMTLMKKSTGNMLRVSQRSFAPARHDVCRRERFREAHRLRAARLRERDGA